MAYKRILTMQDISCVGQCSMTVALPILSAWGHETCILPTTLLSTHTGGFGKPVAVHFNSALKDMVLHWRENGICFDGILVGYLGSTAAVETAEEVLDTMLAPGGVSVVDPAMADNGKLYAGFDDGYVRAMGMLCRKADIILPNVTEAALLSEAPYREELDESYAAGLLEGLGHPCTLLTGVGYSGEETGVLLRDGDQVLHYSHSRIGKSYHGTGDIFAACFTGALMRGKRKFEAARIAADFTRTCIEKTAENPAHWYGVKFEAALPELLRMMQADAEIP